MLYAPLLLSAQHDMRSMADTTKKSVNDSMQMDMKGMHHQHNMPGMVMNDRMNMQMPMSSG